MATLKILFNLFLAFGLVWIARDLFLGKIFSGWLGMAMGFLVSCGALLNFRDAVRPLLGSLLTLVGNRK